METVSNLAGGGTFTLEDTPVVTRATDPVITPPYTTPVDFAAQWATPLDPTELLTMAEEVTLYKYLPVLPTTLKEDLWREMNILAFTSGSAYVSFQNGTCPEEFYHNGSNTSVTLKAQGAKKSLGISDIMHSMGVAALPMGGINNVTKPATAFEGLPGFQNLDSTTIGRIADMKAQEIAFAAILVMNGQDRLLVQGNSNSNSLEYDGLERFLRTGTACHQPATSTGTFSAIGFDRFLAEHPIRPTTLFGHPTALQELQAGYFQLGFQQSQQIVMNDGNRIVPGYNFAQTVNTCVGSVSLVGDLNFTRTNTGNSTFQSTIYALRMSHNGIPLVYRRSQIPLSFKDLVPGCTAVSFAIWEVSALVCKHLCAHSIYPAIFSGRIVSTVPLIGA